ncbi:MAG: AfsR/SARP family transcriptional regulator [Gemmatimonadaceae bacterium]
MEPFPSQPLAPAASRPPLRLSVLGHTEIEGRPGAEALLSQPKRFALLVYLALARPRGFQRRDRVVAVFWPAHDQEGGRAALRKALYALRQALGDDAIIARGDEDLAVNGDVLWCDAAEVDVAIAQGRLAQAMALYRGDLLDGWFGDTPAFEQWVELERARLREATADAAWALAQRFEAGAELTMATRWARTVARLAPLDERVIRRVIQLLDRSGDRAGAGRADGDFAARCRRELEVEPAPETTALIQRLRGQLGSSST